MYEPLMKLSHSMKAGEKVMEKENFTNVVTEVEGESSELMDERVAGNVEIWEYEEKENEHKFVRTKLWQWKQMSAFNELEELVIAESYDKKSWGFQSSW